MPLQNIWEKHLSMETKSRWNVLQILWLGRWSFSLHPNSSNSFATHLHSLAPIILWELPAAHGHQAIYRDPCIAYLWYHCSTNQMQHTSLYSMTLLQNFLALISNTPPRCSENEKTSVYICKPIMILGILFFRH